MLVKLLPWLLGSIGLFIVILEVGLRLVGGFGSPLIYVADPAIGYLAAPNQRLRRFGKRISINAYSMRSREIEQTPAQSALRVLMLGDSIVNGGWWTDQTATIAALLEQQLMAELAGAPDQTVEVLNASANSWGPRNEWAYVQHFGSFGAKIIIQVINTDDLFAVQPSPQIVGGDPNYPDRRPATAIQDMIQRYWLRPARDPALQKLNQEPGDRVGNNLAAIASIQAYAQSTKAEFLLVMTPLKRELATQGGPRDYETVARKRLQDWVEAEQVLFIDMLPKFDGAAEPLGFYRDTIHLSPTGNQRVSESIMVAMQDRLGISIPPA